MSSDPKSPTVREPETGSAEEQFRRDRRRLFGHALIGVPVVISIMAKPAWAGPGSHSTNFSCHSMLAIVDKEDLAGRVASDPGHFGIGEARDDGVMFESQDDYFAQCDSVPDDAGTGGTVY